MNKRALEYYKNIKRNPSHQLFQRLFYITPEKVIMPDVSVTLGLDGAGNPIIKKNASVTTSKLYEAIKNDQIPDLSFEERYNSISNTVATNSPFGSGSLFNTGIKIIEGLYINKT